MSGDDVLVNGESAPVRPLDGSRAKLRLAPFVGIAVVALIAILLQDWRNTAELTSAVVATATLAAAAFLMPWRRLPAWSQALPPLAFFGVVVLLRDATGGHESTISALAIVPVLWFALYGNRTEIVVALAGCISVFVGPMVLIGPPDYPVGELVRGVLITAISGFVSLAAHGIVRRHRQRIRDADLLRTLAQAPSISAMRTSACRVAKAVSHAKVAVLFEPDTSGHLTCTASEGVELVGLSLSSEGEPSGSWIAFNSQERYLVADIMNDTTTSRRMATMAGVKSAIFEPLLAGGRPSGVFVVGFTDHVRRIDDDLSATLQNIARETSWALQRALYVERLDALAQSASDIVTLQDIGGSLRYVSDSVRRILGYQAAAFQKQFPSGMLDVAHPDDRRALTEFHAARTSGKSDSQAITFRAQHADSHWVWLEMVTQTVEDPETGVITQIRGASRDITERIRSEQLLREANDRLSSVLNAATEHSIVRTDRCGTINVFNVGAERMLGYKSEEMVGRASMVQLHERQEVAARAAELNITPGFEVFVAAAFEGRAKTREWTYISKADKRIPVSVTMSATHDASGEVDGYIAIATDMSERNAALRSLQAALSREQALVSELRGLDRSKQDLIASVTHDLKTPLTSIRAYTELLIDSGTQKLDDRQKRSLEVIDRNSDRLVTMIDEMLRVARSDKPDIGHSADIVDLASMTSSIIDSMRALAVRSDIKLAFSCEDHVAVKGDIDHLERAISNLVSNAIKFTESEGSVSVELRTDAANAVLTVSDTGVGIPPDELTNIFERFQRASNATKASIPGTGIGLTTARDIVEHHGGRLTVQSAVGIGSTFTVRLPLDKHRQP